MSLISKLDELVRVRKRRYLEAADRLWDAPETRWQEHASMAEHVALLQAEGFGIDTAITGIPTAFRAEFGRGGPIIAFLGEYDALDGFSQASGVPERTPNPDSDRNAGHACGHHLLGAAAMLAAAAVKDYLGTSGLAGQVRYYGCPAEEAGACKSYLVAAGAFDDVDTVIAWHPSDVTRVKRQLTLAYCQVYYHFSGVAAHAGTSAHLGRSALDAVELMNVGANFLREHIPGTARLHYAITDAGGNAPNVVQAAATVYYAVRATTVTELRAIYARLNDIAEGAALMTGTKMRIEFDAASSEILPNETLEMQMQQLLVELGPVPFDEADQRNAAAFAATLSQDELLRARCIARVDLDDGPALHDGVLIDDSRAPRPVVGYSTDVGDVSWAVPTVQCSAAVACIGTHMHAWQMVAQGKLPAAHKGAVHAATLMAATAASLFEDPSLVSAGRVDFDNRLLERPYLSPIPPGILAPPLRFAGPDEPSPNYPETTHQIMDGRR